MIIFRGGGVKIEMAKDYDKIEESDGFLSVFIPMIKYHTRWTELSKTDFNRLFKQKITQPYYTAGFWICPLVDKARYSVEYSNAVATDMIERGNKSVTIFDGNEIEEQISANKLYEVDISEQNLDWLLKIKKLCDDNEANLALVKIPTMQMPNLSQSNWTIYKSNYMKDISNKYNIPFYDLLYDYSSVVDFSKDTADKGSHLNFSGAEKVSCVVGEILRDNFQFPAVSDAQYDSMLKKYEKIRAVETLETQTEFAQYVNLLSDNLDKWTVLMSVSNDSTYGMTNEDYTFMKDKLGLNLFRDCDPGGSYIAVLSDGKLLYESSSNQVLNHTINVNGDTINLLSSNWITSPKVSIKINGTEYSQDHLGLNIVVFDNESNLVIDSVAFETPIPKGSAIRSISQVHNFTRAYEKKMCF